VNGDGYCDVVVGAMGAAASAGRAYVFAGGPSGLTATPAAVLTATDPLARQQFGYSVASAGDVNGDGFADVLVGAPGYGADTGAAYLFLGARIGIGTTPTSTMLGGGGGTQEYGTSVSCAGDVNVDGYADFVVSGTPTGAPPPMENGRADVFAGHATMSATPGAVATATGPDHASGFGFVAVGIGDVNGDAHGDLAIGAFAQMGSLGAVYVYTRVGSGGLLAPDTMLPGTTGQLFLGDSVAAAGDVDRDGFADLVVGANGSASVLGQVHVHRGTAGGIETTPLATFTSLVGNDQFGYAVASAWRWLDQGVSARPTQPPRPAPEMPATGTPETSAS
jgi:hypothetical protein